VWFDEFGAQQGVIETFSWENFQRGSASAPPALPFVNFNLAKNYEQGAALADTVAALWRASGGLTTPATGGGNGWRRLSQRDGVVAGTPYLPGEINDTLEETLAFYVKADFGWDDPFGNGITVDGNIGLRYVETKFESDGGFNFPQESTLPVDSGAPGPAGPNRCVPPTDLQPGQTFSPPAFCALPASERAAIRAFSNGASPLVTAVNTYENLLPSFNLKVGLNEEMIVRFAYSKGISRPDLGLTRNYFTLSPLTQDDPRTPGADAPPPGFTGGWFGFGSSGGNPFLQPVEADNYDLSYEWYFDEAGSLTLSAFYKEIDNIIVTGQGDISFTNNGVTIDNVFTSQPTNSDETGKVKGVEIAYQQFYDMLPAPFDGVGVQATYTYIQSDGVQSSGVSNTSEQPAANNALVNLGDLPLQGLSEHNYNVALIYEKGPLSTRLAYNWRSEYLVTPRDVITPFYPIFQEASGQLDGSLFYTVNDNLKIGLQGANLLNEITQTTSFIPNSDGRKGFRSAFQNDRRITASVRFNF
jgi:TonB-dependent receptor